MAEIPDNEARFLEAALHVAAEAQEFLAWMEGVSEQLAPQRTGKLAAETQARFGERLPAAIAGLEANPPSEELRPFAERVRAGAAAAGQAFHLFTTFHEAPPPERIARILGSMHFLSQAQEHFYTVRMVLPPFARHWFLGGCDRQDSAPTRDQEGRPTSGLIHVSAGGHHGGFALYVPEDYTPERAWPVIIALHGGSGNGRDFIWTWLREAKSRGYVLISPKAVNDTWGDVEERGLFEILGWASDRFHLDPKRILLTGLSDGGTFTFTASPIPTSSAPRRRSAASCIRPLGNLARAKRC